MLSISPMVCIWGVPHAPKSDATAIRGAEPNQKDASCLGVPKPHISDGVYLGDAQAPRCLWGVPHAPKTDAAAIRGAEPNFSFFTFHF